MATPPVIDGHVHLVDFFQETEGIDVLLSQMDSAGIRQAVIMGLPVTKEWSANAERPPERFDDDDAPVYYYSHTDQLVHDAVIALEPAARERFAPLLCGFNPVNRYAIRHIERMVAAAPGFWRGIGEVLCRHDRLSTLTAGEPATPNHPALEPIYAWCAREQLPILLHQNLAPEGDTSPLYLEELTWVLRQNPQTTFVWPHCGISRLSHCHNLLAIVEDLLQTYPNLHADLSWLIFDREVARDGELSSEWVKLIERHHKRFCLGSDCNGVFRATYASTMRRYEPLLQALSSEAAQSVAFGTARRLYFGG